MAKQKTEAIPKFKNYAEEAKFWDSHDTTEFADQSNRVRVKFAKNLSDGITIRFDTKTLNELRLKAHEKGIGPTTLARMWILERLKKKSA